MKYKNQKYKTKLKRKFQKFKNRNLAQDSDITTKNITRNSDRIPFFVDLANNKSSSKWNHINNQSLFCKNLTNICRVFYRVFTQKNLIIYWSDLSQYLKSLNKGHRRQRPLIPLLEKGMVMWAMVMHEVSYGQIDLFCKL